MTVTAHWPGFRKERTNSRAKLSHLEEERWLIPKNWTRKKKPPSENSLHLTGSDRTRLEVSEVGISRLGGAIGAQSPVPVCSPCNGEHSKEE